LKIYFVSIRLAILNHPSSILKPSPTPPYTHTPTPYENLNPT